MSEEQKDEEMRERKSRGHKKGWIKKKRRKEEKGQEYTD